MTTTTATAPTKPAPRELGDLRPIRDMLEELEQWAKDDRERRGEDEVVHALTQVRRKLVDALADAENPRPELTIKEYAKLHGISVWAAYKRYERGQIAGADKKPGRGIVIPAEAA